MCKIKTIASKNTFFIKSSIFCWSPKSPLKVPLEVPDVTTFRGPSGEVPGTLHPGWVIRYFNKVNRYSEEINGNEYLMLVPTNDNKEKIKKYEELRRKIRDLIRSVTKNSSDYDKKYMKIKFNSDDELPLKNTVKIPSKIRVVRIVFYENNKYYPQVFSDECLYKL